MVDLLYMSSKNMHTHMHTHTHSYSLFLFNIATPFIQYTLHTNQLTCKSEGYAHRIELVTTCDNCPIHHCLWGGSYPQSGCQACQWWSKNERGSEDPTIYHLSYRITLNIPNWIPECYTAPLQQRFSCHSACQCNLFSRTNGTMSTGGQCHHSICKHADILVYSGWCRNVIYILSELVNVS